jgi:NodT family efflux transporter outer membrane factor (OMF) lipoprotein
LTSRTLLAPALAAALLCGCAAVGPNFAPPAAPSAAGFAMKGDTQPVGVAMAAAAQPAAQWWRSFGSDDLDRVIRQALNDSPTLAEADATLAQAQANAAAAGAQLGPQGTLNASVAEDRINLAAYGFTGFSNPTVSLYSVGGTVSYDLDLFGGRRRAAESAKARAQAENYRAGAAYLTLTGDVALQAVQIAALRAQIEAVKAVIADDRTNLDLARKAQDAGGAPPSAQVSVRAQLAEDQATLPPLNQALGQARHALALLVGRAPSDWAAPDFDLADLKAPAVIPIDLPSQLAHRRPDILAAEADLHAATADIGVQQAKLYPDITLNAGLTQTALTPGKILDYGFSGWNVGPGLSLPILGRAGLKDQQTAAQAQARAAFARYQQTVLKAFGQVADALQGLASDNDAIAAEADAQAQARKNLDNMRFAYAHGGTTLLDVTDAQRSLNRARMAYAQAQGRKLTDVVRLYMATGADWTALGAERIGQVLSR